MVKEIAIILAIITAGGGATTLEAKPMEKPPRAEQRYEIVEDKPTTLEEKEKSSATEAFNEEKSALDKKYEKMFALEKELDEIKNDTKDIKEEYHALKRAYEREFTRIIFESLQSEK